MTVSSEGKMFEVWNLNQSLTLIRKIKWYHTFLKTPYRQIINVMLFSLVNAAFEQTNSNAFAEDSLFTMNLSTGDRNKKSYIAFLCYTYHHTPYTCIGKLQFSFLNFYLQVLCKFLFVKFIFVIAKTFLLKLCNTLVKLSKSLFTYLLTCTEVRNSWITKSSYKNELRKMTSHFQLLTRNFLHKFFFGVTNSTS